MTSLFDTTHTTLTEDDPNKKYLDELVGDNKKFKDAESLAKGKYISDNYIKTLERQMDEMRNDLLREREENTARAKLQELIDKVSAQQGTTTQQPITETASHLASVVKPYDPTEIESLVSRKIQETKINDTRDKNFNLVKDKLVERFGPNYPTVLEQQIRALDLTVDEANELARNRPQVFLKTFGLDEPQRQENFQSPPRSNSNTSSFKPTEKKRTWSYYQDMKRTNPKEYYSAKTNIQMHNDQLALGEAFGDGDFNVSGRDLLRSTFGTTQL